MNLGIFNNHTNLFHHTASKHPRHGSSPMLEAAMGTYNERERERERERLIRAIIFSLHSRTIGEMKENKRRFNK